jgi:hypothetical protein
MGIIMELLRLTLVSQGWVLALGSWSRVGTWNRPSGLLLWNGGLFWGKISNLFLSSG